MKKLTLLIIYAFFFIFSIAYSQQWEQCNNGLTGRNIQDIVVNGTYIFACSYGQGVFLSTNDGTSWSPVNTGLTNLDVICLEVSGTNIFVGTEGAGGGVFLSTNNGASWSLVSTGLTNLDIYYLLVDGTNIFAGTFGGGVFLSTNNGTSWSAVNEGLTNLKIQTMAVSGDNIFVGTWGSGVFVSEDNGSSWTQTSLTGRIVNSLLVSGTDIFAGSQEAGGVNLSTDNGKSWNQVNSGLTNKWVFDLAISGSYLFATTWGGGVFLSTNYASNWTVIKTGLTNLNCLRLAINGSTIFVGTQAGGVYKMDLTLLGVDEITSNENFDLYPNPISDLLSFRHNLQTRNNFTFELDDITFSIVNQLGIQVQEKCKFDINTDNSIQIDTKSFDSGIYYCVIKVGNIIETKKFVIIR